MLDDEEMLIARNLYSAAFKNAHHDRFKPLLDYYNQVTGFAETNHNAVMHHIVGLYGPACEVCSKPYRTPQAAFCAACGNKRIDYSHA
ncbi:hypothetical protein [Mucilaginibacter sp.]